MVKFILCTGLVCLDIVSVCQTYPEEDTDVRALSQQWRRGGNASTTAVTLAHLGSRVEFFGTVPGGKNLNTQSQIGGGQIATEFVIKDLLTCGVAVDNIVKCDCDDLPISMVTINNSNGSRTIIHHRGKLPEITVENFLQLDLNKYSWIHLEGRSAIDTEQGTKLMQIIKTFNNNLKNKEKIIKISLELEKSRQTFLMDLIKFVDVVIVSKDYAESIGYKTACDAANGFAKLCRPQAQVIIPWGEKGAAYAEVCASIGSENQAISSGLCPAFKVDNIIDTLGAGDVFNGALIHALSLGTSLLKSVQFACKVAGNKISSYGFKCIRTVSQDMLQRVEL